MFAQHCICPRPIRNTLILLGGMSKPAGDQAALARVWPLLQGWASSAECMLASRSLCAALSELALVRVYNETARTWRFLGLRRVLKHAPLSRLPETWLGPLAAPIAGWRLQRHALAYTLTYTTKPQGHPVLRSPRVSVTPPLSTHMFQNRTLAVNGAGQILL